MNQNSQNIVLISNSKNRLTLHFNAIFEFLGQWTVYYRMHIIVIIIIIILNKC